MAKFNRSVGLLTEERNANWDGKKHPQMIRDLIDGIQEQEIKDLKFKIGELNDLINSHTNGSNYKKKFEFLEDLFSRGAIKVYSDKITEAELKNMEEL